MKISIITPSFYPATVYGGPIFSTLYTAQELAKIDGVEIYVSSTNANRDDRLNVEIDTWHKFADSFWVKYYNETISDRFSWGLLYGTYRDIKMSDIVYIQYIFSLSTPISLLYARVLKKRVLLSPRGSLCKWCLSQGSRFKKLWLKILISPFANTIVWHVTSPQERDDTLSIYPDAKVEVITNGVDFKKFQNYNRLNPNEFIHRFAKVDGEADTIIISMGRLQKEKGFDILIDSFSRVVKLYPKSKLFIAGEDSGERKNLKREISGSGLEDKIFLVGEVVGDEKIDFFSNSDLFVLASHDESFGNVYIESLASGTPIVATKSTPWSSVEEEGCGKWVEGSIDDITRAILELLKEDQDRLRRNSKRYAKRFEWKNIALEFKALFENMLDKKV
jgi:glycosyltransferase involved in cell wall biosynthesis